MFRVLASESTYLSIAALGFLLLTMGIGNWLVALVIVLASYIATLYYRLLRFEKWVSRGTKTSEVFDDNGFLDVFIRHLYSQRKSSNQRKSKTKQILNRLKKNISALPDATVLLNADHEVEWSNEPARYLLNIHPRVDHGLRITNLVRDPQFVEYLKNHKQQEFVEIESVADKNRTIHIRLVPYGNNQLLMTARNVNEKKRLQESLKQFVANASHELMSPLTVISGHLEMLESESNISAIGKKSVKTAQRQAVRMQALIKNLLFLSQAESYQLQPNEGETLAVDTLLNNVISGLKNDCDPERLKVTQGAGLALRGIRTEVEGLCRNLIENAFKYSEEGTPIEVSWSENDQSEFTFAVTDHGEGIPEHELSDITRRHYRGKSALEAQIEGTGLGLAIVKHCAQKHGASLDITSELGEGSTFSVTFPSYRCSHTDDDTPSNVVKLQAS